MGLKDLKANLGALKRTRVLVGIPEASGARKSKGKGEPTNVQLAFIHSNGSPRLNIPPRPFLEPAIAQPETQEKIAEHMRAAAILAIEGNESGAMGELTAAGQVGMEAAKDYIISGGLAPNAPITINGGWMRNKISGKIFHVKGKGSSRPLIDTASLQNSITHIIERK